MLNHDNLAKVLLLDFFRAHPFSDDVASGVKG
jgi:hypothetical protein